MVPTPALQQDLVRQGFRDVSVVARGVDTVRFSPERRSAALRSAWGAGPGTWVVAHVGRLAPEKNLGLLLQALGAHPQLRTLHRPANLEDLFLKLTGRQIREEG